MIISFSEVININISSAYQILNDAEVSGLLQQGTRDKFQRVMQQLKKDEATIQFLKDLYGIGGAIGLVSKVSLLTGGDSEWVRTHAESYNWSEGQTDNFWYAVNPKNWTPESITDTLLGPLATWKCNTPYEPQN